VLDRNEVVLEALRFIFSVSQQWQRAATQSGLGSTGHLWEALDPFFEILDERVCSCSKSLNERATHSSVLFENGNKQMLRDDLRVAAAHCVVSSEAHRFLALGRESVHLHGDLGPHVGAASDFSGFKLNRVARHATPRPRFASVGLAGCPQRQGAGFRCRGCER
jgi:hypothetical protein